jgi:hypothetical protein
MHSPTVQQTSISVFLMTRSVVRKYSSILIHYIKQVHTVAIGHPLQVLVWVALVKIINYTHQPSFSAPQEL